MSRSRLVAYWVTTGLVASSMVSGGVAHVLHMQLYLFVLPYATKWRSGRRTD